MRRPSRDPDWDRKLPPAVKAEVLAATFHLLTDHMPQVWRRVPKWLREQVRQAMADCGIECKDFSKKDLRLCNDYCQWLNEKYPQPGSTLAALLKKRALPKRPRYLHYAIVANNWVDAATKSGQTGCMTAKDKRQAATSQLSPGDDSRVERMPRKKCPVCNER